MSTLDPDSTPTHSTSEVQPQLPTNPCNAQRYVFGPRALRRCSVFGPRAPSRPSPTYPDRVPSDPVAAGGDRDAPRGLQSCVLRGGASVSWFSVEATCRGKSRSRGLAETGRGGKVGGLSRGVGRMGLWCC